MIVFFLFLGYLNVGILPLFWVAAAAVVASIDGETLVEPVDAARHRQIAGAVEFGCISFVNFHHVIFDYKFEKKKKKKN